MFRENTWRSSQGGRSSPSPAKVLRWRHCCIGVLFQQQARDSQAVQMSPSALAQRLPALTQHPLIQQRSLTEGKLQQFRLQCGSDTLSCPARHPPDQISRESVVRTCPAAQSGNPSPAVVSFNGRKQHTLSVPLCRGRAPTPLPASPVGAERDISRHRLARRGSAGHAAPPTPLACVACASPSRPSTRSPTGTKHLSFAFEVAHLRPRRQPCRRT